VKKWTKRQRDFYDQPAAFRSIRRADGASMNLNGAFGDRQPQAGAPEVVIRYSPEWQKYVRHHVFGYPWPVIAD
jgi:hypothetical protein